MNDLTVIIPTKDRPRLAANAARMARAQHDVTPEVIVVDGSSPANTALLRELVGDDCRVIAVPESGVSHKRNVGIEAASTKFVAFLDDDDFWMPDKLSRQLDALSGSGRSWSVTGSTSATSDLRFIGASLPDPDPLDIRLLSSAPPQTSSVVMERALAFEVGGFKPEWPVFEDWDFMLRCAMAEPSPAVVDDLSCLYVVWPQSTCADYDQIRAFLPSFLAEYEELRARHGVDFDHEAFAYGIAYRYCQTGTDRSTASGLWWQLFRDTRNIRYAVYAATCILSPEVLGRALTRAIQFRSPDELRRRSLAIIEVARTSPFSPLAVQGI